MPFVSDEQRKAAFANMNRRGGRTPRARRPPRTPTPTDDPIMEAIGAWIAAGGNPFTPLPPGQGIPGLPGGPVTLTGGAVYNTPGSSWYLSDNNAPPQGQAPGSTNTTPYGIAPNIPDFIPAETFWGYVYLMVQGIDPITGQTSISTGTLSPRASSPLTRDFLHERMASQYFPTAGEYTAFGGEAPSGPTTRTNEPRPSWASNPKKRNDYGRFGNAIMNLNPYWWAPGEGN